MNVRWNAVIPSCMDKIEDTLVSMDINPSVHTDSNVANNIFNAVLDTISAAMDTVLSNINSLAATSGSEYCLTLALSTISGKSPRNNGDLGEHKQKLNGHRRKLNLSK